MRIWLDDIRPAPNGFIWVRSVNEAIALIRNQTDNTIELIDCDHDLGDYACDGGDAVKLLDWLEEEGRSYPIRIHTMNPVGRDNMRAIIRKNNWREVF